MQMTDLNKTPEERQADALERIAVQLQHLVSEQRTIRSTLQQMVTSLNTRR